MQSIKKVLDFFLLQYAACSSKLLKVERQQHRKREVIANENRSLSFAVVVQTQQQQNKL